jgi:hypothetical protein
MPKDPKGRKRPADVISNAVHVMRIGTGEIELPPPANEATVQRASKGGAARAKSLPAKQRSKIAAAAAKARWRKHR